MNTTLHFRKLLVLNNLLLSLTNIKPAEESLEVL